MRPIFIVGCPRSGTTLLRNLLRSHPNIAIPTETHFIPRFYRAFGDPTSDEEALRLARRILATPRLDRWGIIARQEDFTGIRSFSGVTSRLFELWAAKQGKPRWGDKTPHYVRDIPLLVRLYPQAQIIHIIRDGRDVALSWLDARMEPNNLYVAARMWKEMVSRGRRDGALLPPGAYMEIGYEALLAEPEAAMRSVCEYLGESYDAVVLRPDTSTASLERRPLLHMTRASTAGDIVRDNTDKWRTSLSLRQRALFESVAGDLLEELGYQVEGLARTLSPVEKVSWETDHAWRHLVAGVWKLRAAQGRRAALSFGWALVRSRFRHAAHPEEMPAGEATPHS